MLKYLVKKSFRAGGKKVTKQQNLFISIEILCFQSKFSLKTWDKFLDNGVIHITKVNFLDWRGGLVLTYNSIGFKMAFTDSATGWPKTPALNAGIGMELRFYLSVNSKH